MIRRITERAQKEIVLCDLCLPCGYRTIVQDDIDRRRAGLGESLHLRKGPHRVNRALFLRFYGGELEPKERKKILLGRKGDSPLFHFR